MYKTIKNIVIVGSGNIATSVVLALNAAEYAIKQVYSRTLKNARLLADKVNAHYTNIPENLYSKADLYILAVSDNEIENVLKTLDFNDSIVVHTSGSTALSIFDASIQNYGVLYFLQTFSKTKIIESFKNIPIFIEASNNDTLIALKILSGKLSEKVEEINSEQRLALHVSAVFACNFVNHLLSIATDITNLNGLDNRYLYPLIRETIDKALSADHPKTVQTGPAVRRDDVTINKHIDFLKPHPDIQLIYKILSKNINNLNNK